MNNNQIEFDLNETLYFESGQEIAEMVSIFLDPDIAVQKYDSYVQIRGLIIVQGEYRRANLEGKAEEETHSTNLTRYIEKVIVSDYNQARFSHRFPVEISVPSHRVDNLNDITVTVDSFDYELPDQNQLKLIASVHIKGINADQAEVSGEEE